MWSGQIGPSLTLQSQGAPPGFKVAAACHHAGDGRSPDLRVAAFPSLPRSRSRGPCSSGITGVALRSQLRGQSRIWRGVAAPHRVPFSSHRPKPSRTITPDKMGSTLTCQGLEEKGTGPSVWCENRTARWRQKKRRMNDGSIRPGRSVSLVGRRPLARWWHSTLKPQTQRVWDKSIDISSTCVLGWMSQDLWRPSHAPVRSGLSIM